jgi:outer membrane scaffolding protein for murein synthesis (MipA/OmpV family)
MFTFIVGKVQPTGFVATTRVIGEVSDTLVATSVIQNAWTYPVGTGVLVSTTFQASDTESTGVLVILNYEDGNSEARIVPRQATTWLPTTKPVKRADLYRLVIGASTAQMIPTAP